MSNTVLTNTSNLLNNIGVILQINAVTFGINANDIAPNKLISKFPVYFMINNTTEVKIETIKNVVKINPDIKVEMTQIANQFGGELVEMVEIDEASYSAKAARAGKDIGKPGKAFAKIAASAAKRYGSKERGKKVAGAVLAKLRKEENQLDEKTLTSGETKKKEEIVKSMKKNFSGFKQQIGRAHV